MFCPNCGKELSDQQKFCPACGTPVRKEPEKSGFAGAVSEDGAQAGVSSAMDSRGFQQAGRSVSPAPAVTAQPPATPPEPAVTLRPPAPAAAPEALAPQPAGPEFIKEDEKPKPKKKKGRKKLLFIPAAMVLALLFFAFLGQQAGPGEEPDSAEQGEQGEQGEQQQPEEDLTAGGAQQLLGYIDQAEQLCDQADEDYNAIGKGVEEPTEQQIVESFRQKAQVLETFLTDLDELRQQAEAVSGLDKNMKSARDEYFGMLRTSRTAYATTTAFLADYLDFFNQYVQQRPEESAFSTTAEYSEALNQWVESTVEQYHTISCPESVKAEWEQYGETLEYNSNIANKVAIAVSYQDWLRYYSARNMETRYNTVEESLYNKFVDCLEGERDHAAKQRGVASDLAEEMHAYAQLPPEEQEEYEFENIKAGRLWINYDAVDTIYPSLYNTYDAFLIVKTGCISGTKRIFVEMEIPGFTQKYKERIDLDPSYRRIYIKPPAVTGELNLNSAKNAQINVTISREDGTVMDAQTFPVTLKSKYDFEWRTDEYGISAKDNILCFLTPEADAITQLKRTAIDEISAMTGGKMESFVGYQQAVSGWNHHTITYLQAAALMRAMYETGIRYNNDSFSISGSNQHILLPEDVVNNQSGLCIETSLVMASALQSAGMHAFLVFPKGHAQVAVEIWGNGEEGTGQYFLIETTALSESSNNRKHFVENANKLLQNQGSSGVITYYNAESWKQYLSQKVEYIIDCNDSRLLGLTPFAN